MIKIIESDDNNILFEERVSLTYHYWKNYGLVSSDMPLNRVKDSLINLSERFPPEKIWIAKKGEKVIGWLSISREDERSLELGRWNPIIKDISQKEVVAGLLKKCIDYSSNINNVLYCSYSYNENSHADFLRYYQDLFHKWGFNIKEQIAFMVLDKRISGLKKIFSSDYQIVNIFTVKTSEISELSYNVFKEGNDRHMRLSKDDLYLEIKKKLSENVVEDLSVAIKKNEEVIGFSIIKDRGFDYHIDLIVIKKQFQGLGLGTYLITLAIDQLSSKEKRITLGVDKLNKEARKLYRKLGFKERRKIVTLERNHVKKIV